MLKFLKKIFFPKATVHNLPQNNELYIGNIDYKVSYHDLKKTFGECGEIVSLKVIKDSQTGKSKGFGFIRYKTVKDAKKALKLNGMQLKSRKILVTFAKKRYEED